MSHHAYTRIRAEAEVYGICKIVPPKEWKPRCQLDYTDENTMSPFPTRLQNVHTLQESEGFDDGKMYTLPAYKRRADEFFQHWLSRHYAGRAEVSEVELARDYWNIVETRSEIVQVEYGNDLHTDQLGSGFPIKIKTPSPNLSQNSTVNGDTNTEGQPAVESEQQPAESVSGGSSSSGANESDGVFNEEYYKESPWNLTNFPVCDSSLLKYIKTPIVGVTVPWLYIGMLFTSFCWHNEDNYMYSVNYSHLGATKQWYGVPASEAKKFERVSRDSFFESFEDSPDLLHHMTTQISPSLLITKNVNVYRAEQDAGSFIITFPQAYHCGFSYGFNIGEAVNFAPVDWLGYGTEAEESYRQLGRETVISNQRMMFTLLHHLNEVELSRTLTEKFARDIIRFADEELVSRHAIRGAGVKDWSEANIPMNNFISITRKDLDYDELKTCTFCKYVCVFTAVACQCNTKKVSCVRHFRDMCKQNKCSVEKRFMLCKLHSTGSIKK